VVSVQTETMKMSPGVFRAPFNNNKWRVAGEGTEYVEQSIIAQAALPVSSGSGWFPAAAPALTLALAMSPWQPAGTGSHLRG